MRNRTVGPLAVLAAAARRYRCEAAGSGRDRLCSRLCRHVRTAVTPSMSNTEASGLLHRKSAAFRPSRATPCRCSPVRAARCRPGRSSMCDQYATNMRPTAPQRPPKRRPPTQKLSSQAWGSARVRGAWGRVGAGGGGGACPPIAERRAAEGLPPTTSVVVCMAARRGAAALARTGSGVGHINPEPVARSAVCCPSGPPLTSAILGRGCWHRSPHAYRPENRGVRFPRNAARPSAKSAVREALP